MYIYYVVVVVYYWCTFSILSDEQEAPWGDYPVPQGLIDRDRPFGANDVSSYRTTHMFCFVLICFVMLCFVWFFWREGEGGEGDFNLHRFSILIIHSSFIWIIIQFIIHITSYDFFFFLTKWILIFNNRTSQILDWRDTWRRVCRSLNS